MKKIFFVIVLSIFLLANAIYAEDTNFCNDPKINAKWEAEIKKNPFDIQLQTLHALRLGLCIKVEKGDITVEQATKIFNEKISNTFIKKRTLSNWLFANLVFALLAPLSLTFCIIRIFSKNTIEPFRIIRNFQLCLYGIALMGAIYYDLYMKGNSKGSSFIFWFPHILLFYNTGFFALTVFLSCQNGTYQRNKKIVISSVFVVAMTFFLTVIVKIELGLL